MADTKGRKKTGKAAVAKTKAVKRVKKAVTKASSGQAKKDDAKQVTQPTAPQPEPVAAPEVRPPDGNKQKKRWWIQVVLLAVVVLVTAEISMLLKGKVEQQRKIQHVRVIGLRGGPPNAAGKFWGPSYIRVDQSRDYVCMVDGNFKKVLVWNTQDGNLVTEITKETAKNETFFPINADFDGQGNLYVLDSANALVYVFTPEFELSRVWKPSMPCEIAVDRKGDVFVSDKLTQEIVKYTAQGKELMRMGKGILVNAGHMATDLQGAVYVMDVGSKEIKAFMPNGKHKQTWPVKFTAFRYPAMAIQGDKIYTSEHDSNQILVYSTKGRLLWNIDVEYPAVMGVDSKGMLYVSGHGGIDQYSVTK